MTFLSGGLDWTLRSRPRQTTTASAAGVVRFAAGKNAISGYWLGSRNLPFRRGETAGRAMGENWVLRFRRFATPSGPREGRLVGLLRTMPICSSGGLALESDGPYPWPVAKPGKDVRFW